MIKIGQGKSPPILQEVEASGRGNIGKSLISDVGIENVALKPAPGAVGADKLVDGIPPLLVSVRRPDLLRRIGHHLPPEKAVQVLARETGDHAIRDIEVKKTVVVEVPGCAGPGPAAHGNCGGGGGIAKAAASVLKQRIDRKSVV